MSLTTRLILAGLLGVSIAAAGAVLWQHYSGLVDAKAELSAEVARTRQQLQASQAEVASLNRAVTRWEEAGKAQAEALMQFASAQREAGAYSKEIKDVLSKHDLGALARSKPGLIEARINTGTERALRLLERASQPAADSTDAGASTAGPAAAPAGRP